MFLFSLIRVCVYVYYTYYGTRAEGNLITLFGENFSSRSLSLRQRVCIHSRERISCEYKLERTFQIFSSFRVIAMHLT